MKKIVLAVLFAILSTSSFAFQDAKVTGCIVTMGDLKGTAYLENLKGASIAIIRDMNAMSINDVKAKYNEEVVQAYMKCNK